MLNETRDVSEIIQIWMKISLNPGPNGGGKWCSTKPKMSANEYKYKWRALTQWTHVWASAHRMLKCSSIKRNISAASSTLPLWGSVRENYDEPPAANRACKDDKAKWFQTCFPRLNWAVWENKLESHFGWYICVRVTTLDKNLTTMLSGCRWLHRGHASAPREAFAPLSDF